jgi:hypothetical protein
MGYQGPSVPPGPPPPTDPYAPSSPPGAYAPPPGYMVAPPEHPHHRGRVAVAVVVAVAAIVVLLLLLNFAGITNFSFLPGSPGKGGSGISTAEGLTFHQAENAGNSTTATRGPGPWVLVEAGAFQADVSVNFPSQIPCGGFEGFAGGATNSGGTGTFAAWWLVYLSTPLLSTSHALFISVYNATGHLDVEVDTEALCPVGGVGTLLGFPGNVSNTNWVIASADAHGGSGFLAAHSNASAELSLQTETSFFPLRYTAVWDLTYSSACSGTAFGSSSSFSAVLNATNASVLSHSWTNQTTCHIVPPTPLPAISLGTPTYGYERTGTPHPSFFENLTISSTRDLSTANFSLTVLEHNQTQVNPGTLPCYPPGGMGACGLAPNAGGWYAMFIEDGAPVGAFPSSPLFWVWSMTGNAVALNTGVSLEIVSATDLSGDTLLVWGDAGGSASVTLA